MNTQTLAQTSILLIILSITLLGCWLQWRPAIERYLAGRKRRSAVSKALAKGLTVTEHETRLKGISGKLTKPYRLRDW